MNGTGLSVSAYETFQTYLNKNELLSLRANQKMNSKLAIIAKNAGLSSPTNRLSKNTEQFSQNNTLIQMFHVRVVLFCMFGCNMRSVSFSCSGSAL